MIMMRTDKSKASLVDFCRYVNGIKPTAQMSMIEIGSFAGDSTSIFCKWFKNVIAIDPWINNIGDITDRVNMNEVFALFQKNMKFFPNLKVIRDFSYNAIYAFAGIETDLIYIDGGHSYEEVKQDATDWLPKVAKGGFISGHDYTRKFPGVIAAVNETVGKPDKVFSDYSWIKRI